MVGVRENLNPCCDSGILKRKLKANSIARPMNTLENKTPDVAVNQQPVKTVAIRVPTHARADFLRRIERDIPEIKRLISLGYTRAEIRNALNLSKVEMDTRLRYVGEVDFASRSVVFQNFRLAKNAYRMELDELKKLALARKTVVMKTTVTGVSKERLSVQEPIEVPTPDARTAMECVKAQSAIESEVMEMAHTLGVIPDAPLTGQQLQAEAMLKLAESIKGMNAGEYERFMENLPAAADRPGTVAVN